MVSGFLGTLISLERAESSLKFEIKHGGQSVAHGENTMADFYLKDSNKHRQRLRQLKPGAARAFANFSKVVFAEDALSSKIKNLIAVSVAHVTQCPWCIDGHTRAAKRLGATDEEIAEAVFVAMEMRAGAAFTHGAIAMAAVDDHQQPQ
jgi:AhpD family alkylhydroperoxidase